MRSADSWIEVVSPAAHIGSDGTLERQIRRIQADALRHALNTHSIYGPGPKWLDKLSRLAKELDPQAEEPYKPSHDPVKPPLEG